MLLVDSSVWVDYFNGQSTRETDHLDRLLGIEPVAIGDLILVEVLQGFRDDRSYDAAKELLSTLTAYDLLGADRSIAVAENCRKLRKKGVTVRKTTDAIIATFCIEKRFSLLFSDRDFHPFVKHLGLQSGVRTG